MIILLGKRLKKKGKIRINQFSIRNRLQRLVNKAWKKIKIIRKKIRRDQKNLIFLFQSKTREKISIKKTIKSNDIFYRF